MQKLDTKSKTLFFLQFLGQGFFLILVIPIMLFGVAGSAIEESGMDFSLFFLFLVLLFGFAILYVVFAYLWAILTYNNYGYELTENGVKIEKGVIWKKYITIPYDRIQNIDIYRGLLARIIGISDLQIQTAGYHGQATTSWGGVGAGSEGKLPGLNPQIAEDLREDLTKKIKANKQGL